jgi:cytochrome c oxidase subunit II
MRPETLAKTLTGVLLAIAGVAGTQAVKAADAPRRIEIVAKRFSYTPGEITLKKGEPVVLVLHSEDVPHGIKFKELNLQTEIGKGASSELPFTPTMAGDFVGHCSHFCGSGHGSMTLMLHVTE